MIYKVLDESDDQRNAPSHDSLLLQNVIVPSLRAAWLLKGEESKKAQRSGDDYEFEEFEV
jgi:hypothetical protein